MWSQQQGTWNRGSCTQTIMQTEASGKISTVQIGTRRCSPFCIRVSQIGTSEMNITLMSELWSMWVLSVHIFTAFHLLKQRSKQTSFLLPLTLDQSDLFLAAALKIQQRNILRSRQKKHKEAGKFRMQELPWLLHQVTLPKTFSYPVEFTPIISLDLIEEFADRGHPTLRQVLDGRLSGSWDVGNDCHDGCNLFITCMYLQTAAWI